MPPQRSRAFAPKVKTGCRTCRLVVLFHIYSGSSVAWLMKAKQLYKIRRVKCDEQKPSCQRCCSTGRKCDGFENYPTIFNPYYGIVVNGSGDDQENRALHFFRTVTTDRLSGDFDLNFWHRHVCQGIITSPAIRHAAMALASIH